MLSRTLRLVGSCRRKIQFFPKVLENERDVGVLIKYTLRARASCSFLERKEMYTDNEVNQTKRNQVIGSLPLSLVHQTQYSKAFSGRRSAVLDKTGNLRICLGRHSVPRGTVQPKSFINRSK